MTRAREFRRRRPAPAAADTGARASTPVAAAAPPASPAAPAPALDPAALLREHLNASLSMASSAASAPGASRSTGLDQPWRARMAEVANAAGLSDEQQAQFERLARTQLDRIREDIPRLLRELKPHFDTPGEAQAKQRYEAGLRALKAELDAQTSELLRGFGLAPDTG